MEIYYKIWNKNKIALSVDGEDILKEVFIENANEKTEEEIKEMLLLFNEISENNKLIRIN